MRTITPSPVADDDGLDPILARPFDPIYEAKLLAWAQGWESRQAEIDRLNYEADLWFYCYANHKTPADYYRHQTTQLWAEASK